MGLANSYKIIRGDLLDLQSGKVREGTSRQWIFGHGPTFCSLVAVFSEIIPSHPGIR